MNITLVFFRMNFPQGDETLPLLSLHRTKDYVCFAIMSEEGTERTRKKKTRQGIHSIISYEYLKLCFVSLASKLFIRKIPANPFYENFLPFRSKELRFRQSLSTALCALL